jgi:hypothetical protein
MRSHDYQCDGNSKIDIAQGKRFDDSSDTEVIPSGFKVPQENRTVIVFHADFFKSRFPL